MNKLDYREAIALEVLAGVYSKTLKQKRNFDLETAAENDPGIRVRGPNLLLTQRFKGINLDHLLKPHAFLVMEEDRKISLVARQLLKIYKHEGLTVPEKLHRDPTPNYKIDIWMESAKIFSSTGKQRTNYETLMVLCWVTSESVTQDEDGVVFHFVDDHTASLINGVFTWEHLGVELNVTQPDCWKILENPKMQTLHLSSPLSGMAIMLNNKFRYTPKEQAELGNALAACEGLYDKENLLFRLNNGNRTGLTFIQLCKLAVNIFNSDKPITSALNRLKLLRLTKEEFMESFEGLIPYEGQFGARDRVEFYLGLQYLITQKEK